MELLILAALGFFALRKSPDEGAEPVVDVGAPPLDFEPPTVPEIVRSDTPPPAPKSPGMLLGAVLQAPISVAALVVSGFDSEEEAVTRTDGGPVFTGDMRGDGTQYAPLWPPSTDDIPGWPDVWKKLVNGAWMAKGDDGMWYLILQGN